MPEQSELPQQQENLSAKHINCNRKEENIMTNKRLMKDERPSFPKRAIITAGMPYGNKSLHFGHVGGMFIHADIFARFLRDRIGKDNVIFLSGTDCYGSPILESYRKLQEDGYEGSLEDYVRSNHENQRKTLENYGISLDFFGASALDEAGTIHKQVSAKIFHTLYRNGYIKKLSMPQFFDEEKGMFLNGRQVLGKCPIPGCTSDKAYADECSLGHQFLPSELINPVSCLSGKEPVLKNVANWYFDLEHCIPMIKEYNDFLRKNTNTRKYQLETVEEFLKKPLLYVPRKYIGDLNELSGKLPAHTLLDEPKKPSVTFEFKNLDDRDKAKTVLDGLNIHYTSGKTLVPFRLSGNVEWGVPFPDCEDLKDLTFGYGRSLYGRLFPLPKPTCRSMARKKNCLSGGRMMMRRCISLSERTIFTFMPLPRPDSLPDCRFPRKKHRTWSVCICPTS